jgi:bifunctional DNase/RNase
MKSISIIAFLTLLLGCATPSVDVKPTDPIYVATRVEIPVSVPCHIIVPAEPVWEVDIVTGPSFDQSKAILAELVQRQDYINQFKAAAKKCE